MLTAGKHKRSLHRPRWRLLFWGSLALVVIALLTASLEITGVTDVINSRRAKQYVTTPITPGRTVNETTKGEESSEPLPASGEDKQQTNAGNVLLSAPTGPFVSNHRPNLGGSPAPNKLQSTCTTTPGATCQIVFEKGSVVKSLPAQQTDKGGSAYWSWELQDIGLDEGLWSVTAKAILGDQTKTATDPIKLEVSN